jgi:hypothetical protein
MNFDRNTQVVNVAARISKETFTKILQDDGSAAADEASGSYEVVVKEKVDPLFSLAIFQHESNFGKKGVCFKHNTKSPGNTRSSKTGVGEIIDTGISGRYVKYPSWIEGFRDLAFRLVDPTYAYAEHNLVTIEQILPVWAPVGDGQNKPEKYIEGVVTFMNRFNQMVTPEVIEIQETGRHLGGDFLDFWRELKLTGQDLHLRTLGFPITEEFKMKFEGMPNRLTTQLFERGGLVKEPNELDPWDVHTLKILQLAEAHKFATANGLLN